MSASPTTAAAPTAPAAPAGPAPLKGGPLAITALDNANSASAAA